MPKMSYHKQVRDHLASLDRKDRNTPRKISGLVVERESDKALLVKDPAQPKWVGAWLPKSQLSDVERDGQTISCTIPGWLAEDKGL